MLGEWEPHEWRAYCPAHDVWAAVWRRVDGGWKWAVDRGWEARVPAGLGDGCADTFESAKIAAEDCVRALSDKWSKKEM